MDNEARLLELPKGWAWVKLSEITLPITRINRISEDPDTEFNYIDIEAIDNNSQTIKEVKTYTWGTAPSRAQQIVESDDILFATVRPYLKNIAIVTSQYNQSIASSGFCILRTTIINSKFLYYYITSQNFINSVNLFAKGTSYPAVTSKIVLNQKIPLAPLDTQNKIIEKIEEIFSELDHSEKNLKKIVKRLKIYKKALLKSAFNGNLKKKTKGAWKNGELGDIYDFVGGGTPSRKASSYWNGNIKWASVKDIQESHLHETSESITDSGLENSSSKVALVNEVILISRINPGKVTIAKSEIAINQDLKIVRPLKDNEINYKFTYYLFIFLENKIIELSKGTTVKGIRVNELNSIKISYPDLFTQDLLVLELDKQNSLADDLSNSAILCLKKIDIYRHMILCKAYNGKLVKSDDTNSVLDLLNRVKEEQKLCKRSIDLIKTQTPKTETTIKKPLLKVLKEEFANKTFSMIDIKSKIRLSDTQLKLELFQLLDNEVVKSFFDEKTKTRLYKLKQ